jgi:hypothetical protein
MQQASSESRIFEVIMLKYATKTIPTSPSVGASSRHLDTNVEAQLGSEASRHS